MRSILEVGSEQLLYFYIAYKDMPYIRSQAIEVKKALRKTNPNIFSKTYVYKYERMC